jgi:eukaryotic-like serine/threonine-protein kinase
VPSAGGEPVELTRLGKGERTHRHPQVVPEHQLLLFTAAGDSVNYDNAQIIAQSLKTGARTTLVRGGHSPVYLSTGHLLYQHEGTLYAARFDARRMALTSLPAPVLEGVSSSAGGSLLSVSRDGTLVYFQGADISNGSGTIVWLDAAGKQQELHSVPGNYSHLRLSPDNRRLAFALRTEEGSDIWVKDLERGATSRLTFTSGNNGHPIWTPDGKAIVYRNGPDIYWIPSDGSGQAQQLTDTGGSPRSFSPDGKYLAYMMERSSLDVFTAPIEGAPGHPRLGKPEPFVATPALEVEPRFSPDGRWIAYLSQESGRSELYVRPFPGPGGRWQISTGGGSYSAWSPKTQELLYESPQGITAVPYTVSGGSFSAGKPRLWTPMHPSGPGGAYNWDIAADGKRLVVLKSAADIGRREPQTELTFLLNFGDELKRKIK